MKCSLCVSNFLEEISSLPILLFSSISLHWSLRKAFLSLLTILWNSAFRCLYLSFSPLLFASLLFTAICKASSDSHLAFLHFFSMGTVLIPVSCTMSQISIHSLSGTVSIRSSPIQSAKTRLGADFGSDHELLIAKFRLKLRKVGKTTRLFRYDLNQIPYDYLI